MVISASSVTTEKKEKLQMQEVIEEFSTEMILGRYLSSLITERSILPHLNTLRVSCHNATEGENFSEY
ncbi:hypothetical protein RIR_jg17225.t1 [Rhizophagus irregularis DAOM 181602=DAOM 197198]|nr:hypothetical protein RIR_jg17225.t1 [Rhizophagus irregularis DAOM 181602=DAOM 197198]